MLDINFIDENKELVEQAIKNKKGEDVDLDRLLKLYASRKSLQQRLDSVNAKRNEAAKNRDIDTGRLLKEESQSLEEEFKKVHKSFMDLMLKIPNIPSPDTPIGEDESGNIVIRSWGNKPEFSFPPKPHWDLGKDLGILDSDTAAEISGARFTYLKGDLAMLQFALIHFAFSVLTNKDKLEEIAKGAGLNIPVGSFVPVIPPVMMKSAVMNRMARLHPIEDRYYFEADDLVLVGSAEHTLGPMFMDKVLNESELPIRLLGYSTAFRREAGSYGKDTRGILRQHQFDKLEMETFVLPEYSYPEQDFLVAIQEYLMKELNLPYQVVLVCTGDMGKPDHRQIDIETWMPGQNSYRETHSADLMGGYQSRRLNTRVKRANGKIEHLHMNDATLIAVGRMLISIMENNQQEDGSIKIPEALQKYMGKAIIEKSS